ncbi:actin binding Rho activating protein b [Genypterus blacodes]|uniref:actin binding Rho activating protein b n=1 Tax=Genypterus blacodes TaxID=154954 RepID=UPI003F776B8A
MSDKTSGQVSQRKPSTNKNIKKLRAISMVCGLAHSWQRWVKENETKQANEPSGWAPSSTGESAEEPTKTRSSKAAPSAGKAHPREASQTQVSLSGETQKTSTSHEETQRASQTEGEDPPVESCIKTKQVVKTVTSKAQEKSAGVGLLTEMLVREALPFSEEIDRKLKEKSSPTRRRKCSNMVSSLTKSWKEVERQQEPTRQGEGAWEGHREDGSNPETERERVDAESGRQEEEQKMGESESAMKIKRPSVSMYKKEAEDANKINVLSKKYSAVGNLKSRWQNWASEHTVNQKLNPFSEYFDHDYSMSLRIQKGEEGYGRPKEGTKTAERAKRAEQHIHREIADMCYVIRTMADPDRDGLTRITFGELFDRYVRISDKVVGILMRARKHEKVAFDGEMLWQGQDDSVVITLLV